MLFVQRTFTKEYLRTIDWVDVMSSPEFDNYARTEIQWHRWKLDCGGSEAMFTELTAIATNWNPRVPRVPRITTHKQSRVARKQRIEQLCRHPNNRLELLKWQWMSRVDFSLRSFLLVLSCLNFHASNDFITRLASSVRYPLQYCRNGFRSVGFLLPASSFVLQNEVRSFKRIKSSELSPYKFLSSMRVTSIRWAWSKSLTARYFLFHWFNTSQGWYSIVWTKFTSLV